MKRNLPDRQPLHAVLNKAREPIKKIKKIKISTGH